MAYCTQNDLPLSSYAKTYQKCYKKAKTALLTFFVYSSYLNISYNIPMNELIFLDTETTGNDVLNDYLFQVCYAHRDEMHCEFFKPHIPISIKSQAITHVTNKMVADKQPFSISPMRTKLAHLLEKNILVAHNAGFLMGNTEHSYSLP
jgi:DNA polymerase III alpha subunit (gram-positive type)